MVSCKKKSIFFMATFQILCTVIVLSGNDEAGSSESRSKLDLANQTRC